MVYTSLPDLEIDRWSVPATLTNDGGTWVGQGWGREFWDADGGLHTSGTVLYVGHGDYEGLAYRLFLAQSPDWTDYILSGWIEPVLESDS
jgi:hypothetical protein